MEKAFKEKKCISSKFELARFHQVTDDIYYVFLYVCMCVTNHVSVVLDAPTGMNSDVWALVMKKLEEHANVSGSIFSLG